MIRSHKDLKRLFDLLDAAIAEPLEVYVIGGANLIGQGITDRPTLDIDVILPLTFPRAVQDAVAKIAKKEGIPENWINTMPSVDARFLADGWKNRASRFYQGKKLLVILLSRKDMLGLKLAAALDRVQPDTDDILTMNPTVEEWDFARQWARNYDANPNWAKTIDQLVTELKEKQHGKTA